MQSIIVAYAIGLGNSDSGGEGRAPCVILRRLHLESNTQSNEITWNSYFTYNSLPSKGVTLKFVAPSIKVVNLLQC